MIASTFTPIAIEISGRTVRAVQLRRAGPGWSIHACAVFPRLEGGVRKPEDEAARIAGVLSRRGFRGRSVVLAAPDERVLAAVVDLPPRASGAPVEQIAANEMARLFKKDPARLETALWDLPASARQSAGHQGMAVACAHEETEPLVDAFEARDLSVLAILPRMTGMVRACAAWLAAPPAVTFILDVGWSLTKLIAVREGAIVSERPIDGGEFARLRQETARRANTPPEIVELLLEKDPVAGEDHGSRRSEDEAMTHCLDQHAERIVEQINVSAAYIGHRYGTSAAGQVFLMGEHGATPGLAVRLAGSLGADTRAVALADIARTPAGGTAPGTAAVCAAGLALIAQEELA